MTNISLTVAERFWIMERRAGRRVTETAERWGFSTDQVKDIYMGREVRGAEIPASEPGQLSDSEIISILRRRANLDQQAVSILLGVSRVTVNRRERGKDTVPPDHISVLLAYLDLMEKN